MVFYYESYKILLLDHENAPFLSVSKTQIEIKNIVTRFVRILIPKVIYTKSALENTIAATILQKIMRLTYVSNLTYSSYEFKILIIYNLYYRISFFFSNNFCQNFFVNPHH